MQSSRLVTIFQRLMEWFYRLVMITVLWWLLSALGLFVLGVMPATAGMYAIMRQWLLFDDTAPILKTMWQSYKREFSKANLVGYFMTLLGTLLFMNVRFLFLHHSTVTSVFMGLTILVLIIWSVTAMYLFPVLVHFEVGVFACVRYACVVGLLRPLRMIVMLAVAVLMVATAFYMRGLLVSFAVAVFGILITFVAYYRNTIFGRGSEIEICDGRQSE